jgi:hypothetical protein
MTDPTDPVPAGSPGEPAASAGGTPEPSVPPEETPSPKAAPPAAPRKSFARRHWGKLTLAAFIIAPTVVFGLWAAIGLNFVYSEGERAGFVQKISEKGWLCKTWEGEMAISTIPGSMPQLWAFSVRSDSVAMAIEATNGKRVVLEYQEKPWVPTTCFGETKYFVSGVRVVGDAPQPM